MVITNEIVRFTDYSSGYRLPDCSKSAINRPGELAMTSQFTYMTSLTILFDVVLFFFSILVTGASFKSISALVLELWQFSFMRNWPEIRKYPRLSFAQYLETRAILEYQNWICKIQGLKFLLFLSYQGKMNRAVKLPPPHQD